MEPHQFELTYQSDLGTDGTDADPSNPLWRALSGLFVENSLLPTVCPAFFSDRDDRPTRWLGVFVLSAGERLLFFPGLAPDIIRVRGVQGTEVKFDTPFKVDHVTLEKDRDSWHVTSPRSKKHQGGPVPTDLGEGRVLWFGFSLQSPAVLRELKRDTVAAFPTPLKSAGWKRDQLVAAREGKEFPLVVMPEPQPHADTFPLVSVIVGPRDFPSYRGDLLGWPYGSQFVVGEPSGNVRFHVREQRIHLDDATDIQFRTVWAPGCLRIPVVLTSPTGADTPPTT